MRAGKCYDVRDDTIDQLYKHYATPDARQWKAVDKTWALTLRKNGRFFLTGYRAGTSGTCGADANGWKLYAKSVEACARQGWTYTRILGRYLSPDLKFVWANKTGPSVTKPKIALKAGNSMGSGAATVKWRPRPHQRDIARYQLQRKVAGGAWKSVALPAPKVWKTNAWIKLEARSKFRVRARDVKGNWGPWSYSAGRRAAVRGPAGTTIAGSIGAAAVVEPRKVRVKFYGRSVALVARTGPGMGKVKVFVHGKQVATVDLKRSKATQRKLVWTMNWGAVDTHAISIKPVNAHARVDFHGFLVLR